MYTTVRHNVRRIKPLMKLKKKKIILKHNIMYGIYNTYNNV